jgi:hypothetical protein
VRRGLFVAGRWVVNPHIRTFHSKLGKAIDRAVDASAPLVDKAANVFQRFWWRLTKRKLVLAAGVAVGGFVLSELVWGEAAVQRKMLKTFEDGGVQNWEIRYERDKDPHIVQRPAVLQDLQSLLRPESSNKYAIIIGENGTAVRQAVRSLEYPYGVVYFSAPELIADFGSCLGRAVGFSPHPFGAVRRFLSGTIKDEPASKQSDEPIALWRL